MSKSETCRDHKTPLPSHIPSHIGIQEDPGGRVADIVVWIDRFYILHDTLRDKLCFHCITSFIYPGVSFLERSTSYIFATRFIYYMTSFMLKKRYISYFLGETKCMFATT